MRSMLEKSCPKFSKICLTFSSMNATGHLRRRKATIDFPWPHFSFALNCIAHLCCSDDLTSGRPSTNAFILAKANPIYCLLCRLEAFYVPLCTHVHQTRLWHEQMRWGRWLQKLKIRVLHPLHMLNGDVGLLMDPTHFSFKQKYAA